MTEKEKAINYIRNTKGITYHLVKKYTDEQIKSIYSEEIKMYLAGLHEGQPKWYKYPEKTPEIGTYLVCFQPENGHRETLELEYTYDNKEELHWLDDDCEVYDEKIIAWTEKPQFKE